MTVPTPEEIRDQVAARVAKEEAAHGTGAKEAHGKNEDVGRGLGTATVKVDQNPDGTFQMGDHCVASLDMLPGVQGRKETFVFLGQAGKRMIP